MPSRTVHLELTITALSLGTWNYVSKIDKYILQHIADPDTEGMQDGYIIRDHIMDSPTKAGIVPHHGMKEVTQRLRSYYFWNSICYYLKEDYEKAGESLARALHYSQDTLLIYSGYDPRHDIIEGDIEKLWITQKDSIIKEVLPELNKDRVVLEPTTTPRYFLPRALHMTYYVLKQFEKEINLAYSMHVDGLKLRRSGSRKLFISSGILFFLSLLLGIVNPTMTAIGIFTSIIIFLVALVKRRSMQEIESKYLLWALGYEKLDMTRQTITETKQTGGTYHEEFYDLILQPYIKPCRS